MSSKLARHLGKLRGYDYANQADDYQARAIKAHPQAHIDALVEAGVLEAVKVKMMECNDDRHGGHTTTWRDTGDVHYRVVQPDPPHEHEWVWVAVNRINCGCGAHFAPTFPYEVGDHYTGPVPEGL